MFDPGWQGAQVKGIEDEDTQDHGNDPVGVIDRWVLGYQLLFVYYATTFVQGARFEGEMATIQTSKHTHVMLVQKVQHSYAGLGDTYAARMRLQHTNADLCRERRDLHERQCWRQAMLEPPDSTKLSLSNCTVSGPDSQLLVDICANSARLEFHECVVPFKTFST